MADVLIRGLDDDTHGELKRRSDAAGMSMQQYVAKLLYEHVQRPTQEHWLERLNALRSVEASGADAVEAARGELP